MDLRRFNMSPYQKILIILKQQTRFAAMKYHSELLQQRTLQEQISLLDHRKNEIEHAIRDRWNTSILSRKTEQFSAISISELTVLRNRAEADYALQSDLLAILMNQAAKVESVRTEYENLNSRLLALEQLVRDENLLELATQAKQEQDEIDESTIQRWKSSSDKWSVNLENRDR